MFLRLLEKILSGHTESDKIPQGQASRARCPLPVALMRVSP